MDASEKVVAKAAGLVGQLGVKGGYELARRMEGREGNIPLRERSFYRAVAESIKDAFGLEG